MNVWIVSREYAEIAEAGGVKNVTCSLAEELAKAGNSVSVFMPLYGCSDISSLCGYESHDSRRISIIVNGKSFETGYAHAAKKGVSFVFICSDIFKEKLGVYTYTALDEQKDSFHVRGRGHDDAAWADIVFQKAAVLYGRSCEEKDIPDIIHCQDAATALVPAFAAQEKVFSHTKFIVTIHNAGAGYHHAFDSEDAAELFTGLPRSVLDCGMNNGRLEPFLLASRYAAITTVSPRYAEELLDESNTATDGLSRAFAERKVKTYGITNGIDIERYDPVNTDSSLLPFAFNPEKKDLTGKYACRKYFLEMYGCEHEESSGEQAGEKLVQYGTITPGTASDESEPVFICYHGRLVRQKGISILIDAAGKLLASIQGVRVVIIGQGEASLEVAATCLAAKYPGRCIYFCGYSRKISRLCIAASDFIALPSNFEPCGLEDFIAQIFGTIPVAHATGGLTKIIDGRTGFLYEPNTSDMLLTLLSALVQKKQKNTNAFVNMIACASSYVRSEYAWKTVVKKKYIPLYKKLLKNPIDTE
jgi:starch synthase